MANIPEWANPGENPVKLQPVTPKASISCLVPSPCFSFLLLPAVATPTLCATVDCPVNSCLPRTECHLLGSSPNRPPAGAGPSCPPFPNSHRIHSPWFVIHYPKAATLQLLQSSQTHFGKKVRIICLRAGKKTYFSLYTFLKKYLNHIGFSSKST